MNDKKCNGWTNYATWRINSELIGDQEFEEPVTKEYIEDLVEHFVFDHSGSMGLMEDYARAFISEVNFYEIAESVNHDIKLQAEYDN